MRLEETILRLLGSRSESAGIRPGEAARELATGEDRRNWRPLLEPARRAARRLAHQGKIVILQGGKKVDPSSFKGPVRLQKSKNRDACR